jgi:hypothetical protein
MSSAAVIGNLRHLTSACIVKIMHDRFEFAPCTKNIARPCLSQPSGGLRVVRLHEKMHSFSNGLLERTLRHSKRSAGPPQHESDLQHSHRVRWRGAVLEGGGGCCTMIQAAWPGPPTDDQAMALSVFAAPRPQLTSHLRPAPKAG